MAKPMTKSQKPAQKTPWLMLAGMMLLGSAGSAGGVFYLMEQRAGANGESQSGLTQPAADIPYYVNVEAFTVNLQATPDYQRLIHVGLSLKVPDEKTQAYLIQRMPQVRSRLISLIAAQKAETLLTPNGKELLSAEILKTFATPFGANQLPVAVTDVLYTQFIVQ